MPFIHVTGHTTTSINLKQQHVIYPPSSGACARTDFFFFSSLPSTCSYKLPQPSSYLKVICMMILGQFDPRVMKRKTSQLAYLQHQHESMLMLPQAGTATMNGPTCTTMQWSFTSLYSHTTPWHYPYIPP
jgi:hypothetical protein